MSAAIGLKRVEIVKLLLEYKRVDHSGALKMLLNGFRSIEMLQVFLTNERTVFTNKHVRLVDICNTNDWVDNLFEAAHYRIWPRIISNDIACVSRETGHLRNKFDSLELESSWMLLLCVKHFCTSQVAARVGDVLREVCSEWICYKSTKGRELPPRKWPRAPI